MIGADLHHPAVGAALTTAADLVGMEVVYVGGLTDDKFTFERIVGDLPGLSEGLTMPRADSAMPRICASNPSSSKLGTTVLT